MKKKNTKIKLNKLQVLQLKNEKVLDVLLRRLLFLKSKYMKMCAVKLKEKRTKISKKY